MSIEAMKLALEALEIVNREMLTLRDELAERGGRPTQGYHQLLWDSSHKVYTDTAIPAAESLRQAIEREKPDGTWGVHQQQALNRALSEQAQPVAASLTVTHAQAAALMLMFEDAEPDTKITLIEGDGHSGKGIYAYYEEYPEEGAEILDATELPPPRKPLTDEQIDAAIKAWFENEIVAGRQPFAKRMRAAFAAALGIKGNT